MQTQAQKPTTIDEYLAQFPGEVQQVLQELRKVIKETAPDAAEKISYGMPGFYQNGMLVWFAVHMRHIGFYPTSEGIEVFKDELAGYKFSKGAVQFPLDQPMPYELIRRLVKHRVEANSRKR